MSKLDSPYFMVHVSSEFLKNGAKAAGQYFKAEKGEVKQFDSLILAKISVPVVNIMLSLELTLKGLIKDAGKRPWGHDVLELFDALEGDVRDRIIEHYRSHDHYRKYVPIRIMAGDGSLPARPGPFTPIPKDRDGVRELLALHRKHFIDFRYLFEYDEKMEVFIYFRELLNLAFSAIKILGDTQNVIVK